MLLISLMLLISSNASLSFFDPASKLQRIQNKLGIFHVCFDSNVPKSDVAAMILRGNN